MPGSGGLALLVTGDGPITTYESFTLPDPPRLVLDIPGAIHAVPQPISARPPAGDGDPFLAVSRATRADRSGWYSTCAPRCRIELWRREPTASRPGHGGGGSDHSDSIRRVARATPAAAKPAGKVTRVDLQNVRGRQQILIRTTGAVMYTVTESSDPLGLLIDVIGPP